MVIVFGKLSIFQVNFKTLNDRTYVAIGVTIWFCKSTP